MKTNAISKIMNRSTFLSGAVLLQVRAANSLGSSPSVCIRVLVPPHASQAWVPWDTW